MDKVMVEMSGGVDSTVAAFMLREHGYEVIGITFRMFDSYDVCDAESAAKKLNLKHKMFNFCDCFRENVMLPFAEGYLNGRTPNPCIFCNKYVKFGEIIKIANDKGCNYIATGHYAVCEFDKMKKRYLLKRSSDCRKDQTYVLYSLTQEQLAHILFPLGKLNKKQVYNIAKIAKLLNSEKSESQDICFVPHGNYAQFIRNLPNVYVPNGNFVDTSGKVLGTHNGIINYTIGQRKGFGIAFGKPLYVVDKNIEKNTVVLGDETDLYTNSLVVEDVNLISIAELTKPMCITAKIRYSLNEYPAVLSKLDGDEKYRIDFDTPQRAVTSGQAVVFYNGDIVVGGGTIL